MKANEFVKQHGWEYSKHIVNEDSVILIDLDYNNLKRLVDAHELVDSYGSLVNAKNRCYPSKFIDLNKYYALKQAILDVESCQ